MYQRKQGGSKEEYVRNKGRVSLDRQEGRTGEEQRKSPDEGVVAVPGADSRVVQLVEERREVQADAEAGHRRQYSHLSVERQLRVRQMRNVSEEPINIVVDLKAAVQQCHAAHEPEQVANDERRF